MTYRRHDILLIGYGNPCRCDDGLGPALAARIEAAGIEGITVEADYQLTPEDAWDVSKHEMVIFADASIKGEAPFFFEELSPRQPAALSTHTVSPGNILYIAEKMFRSRPKAFALGIRGYDFSSFEERLSEGAQKNLEEAFLFIDHMLRSGSPPGA